jgi:hypothetical protein
VLPAPGVFCHNKQMTNERGLMTRRSFVAGLALAATLGGARAAAQSLEPVDVDWDRVFRLTWEMSERYRKPHVIGRIENVSNYGASQIQLLVERLDASGRPVGQQVVWLAFKVNPGEHAFFDVPVPERGATYRVRVYAFSRKFGTSGA